MKSTWHVVVGLLAFWLLVLLYMNFTIFSGDVSEHAERQLAQALRELDMLQTQNNELKALAEQLKDVRLSVGQKRIDKARDRELATLRQKLNEANEKLMELGHEQVDEKQAVDKPEAGDVAQLDTDGSPTIEHEELRRKVENGVYEFWYFIQSQLSKVQRETPEGVATNLIEQILLDGAEHKRVLLHDVYNLSTVDEVWRKQEARDLSDIVQARLTTLQNPKDCSKAKKLVCNINKGCGYGCQMHHVMYCFLVAFGTQRTLIVESKGWRYSPEGLEKYFLPLSKTCTDRSGASSRTWGGGSEKQDPPSDMYDDQQGDMFQAPEVMAGVQVVELPIVDSLYPKPRFLPQAIPSDLAPRLIRLHGHPFVWWAGQFLKYMLRPQPSLANDMDEIRLKLGFRSPIVGVHVRRTDKLGTEAAFHGIDEYMTYVDEYYDLLELRQTVARRRIYLATDDPNLLSETKNKYPRYEVISENTFSQSAGLSSRYSDPALRAIIMDIHFLSLSDYLVCTFSSQVCRIAYEIMQTMHPDASRYFKSLDDIYYYGGQTGHTQVALYDHEPSTPEEIEMKAGDKLGIAGNHWDGYSKGVNRRTGKTGLYPSFKVREQVEIVDVPVYAQPEPPR